MAGYERKTALAPAEILARAEELLPVYIGLSRSRQSSHGATYAGDEGTVVLSVTSSRPLHGRDGAHGPASHLAHGLRDPALPQPPPL